MRPPRLARAWGRPCPYCNAPMKGNGRRADSPTREHINPRANGGGPIIIVCKRCNSDKASYSLRSFAAWLLMTNSPRGRIVSRLAAALDNGTLRVLTSDEVNNHGGDPIGIGPGIFA